MSCAQALSASEVFKRVEPGIVIVSPAGSGAQSQGSGVLIEAHSVVTNCHVVKGARIIKVLKGSVQRSAKVRYLDEARDLCQLELDDAIPESRPISEFAWFQRRRSVR